MGRPKKFERNAVLIKALELFWRRGYRDVSVRDLASEMGINIATLYSEFGDKERLYGEALDLYEAHYVPGFIGALEQPGADRETIAEVLGAFVSFAESGTAPGCLITNSAIELAPDQNTSRDALARYVQRLRSGYANALGQSKASNDMADKHAQALTATTLGLFVMIRAHVSPEIVESAVSIALESIASPPSRCERAD